MFAELVLKAKEEILRSPLFDTDAGLALLRQCYFSVFPFLLL